MRKIGLTQTKQVGHDPTITYGTQQLKKIPDIATGSSII